MDNRYLSLPLAVALALASPCADALGLGQLQVKSGLHQPLVAEIPIISATPSELDQLDVRLASPDAFARVGLERPGELTANLQFSVGKNARGQPVILVTTTDRFSEPLLSFLIEAEWGKGRVTREYTALIDPPYIAAAVIQPMLTPAIAATPAPVAQPMAQPIAPAVTVAAAPEPEPAQTVPAMEPEPIPVIPEPEPPPPQPIVQAPPPPAPAPVPRPTPPPPAPPLPPAPREREPLPVAAPEPAPAPASEPGRYGPVASGQTLWSIANSVRPDPAVSINQMMVALLRANPDAFAEDNINLLKRGAVLRVPGQDEVGRLSDAEAAALVSQQAAAWRSPRQAVPQPADSSAEQAVAAGPPAAKPAPARVASAKPARPTSRLEIVPPAGNSAARGAQSGAAAGAGGTELRAELAQAREDLAARTSEVTELKSRVAELEQQDADRQRLIEMQNSQMKELQDRLAQMESAPAAVPAAAAPAAEPAAGPNAAVVADEAGPAAADDNAKPAGTPWYLNPFVLFAGLLVVLGALVLGLRRNKNPSTNGEPSAGRLSDDEALRASIAKTQKAGEKIVPGALAAAPAAAVTASSDREVDAFRDAVRARPQDIEAHLSLLRLLHMRGNFTDFEAAAQEMRTHVPNTMDPRWREVVIMGASLMPANSQFAQAGWNTPRFDDSATALRATPLTGPAAAAVPASSAPAVVEPPPEITPAPVRVFEAPAEEVAATTSEQMEVNELDFDEYDAALGDGRSSRDIHRNEAQVMAEDEASATRIELAKAYLDIGDLDGARSMLEEVVAEGGPSAQAEAGRILKEIG